MSNEDDEKDTEVIMSFSNQKAILIDQVYYNLLRKLMKC